ncbi:nuclear transport factor 2 family protein [Piscinibacter sakaiensis]|uniref:Alternative dihydrofolate reductase 3 n=1 Tax=Piscinibacter sakaiensis TaxID=1547922 RepID=A0A0K8P034_PISS1|nr:nuclear transport factor 2 family protein [Piscinibacter sakaiensis]GAP36012.1 alternative dihydrofolate reductase 3 [Piscinibacter sakaiensis]
MVGRKHPVAHLASPDDMEHEFYEALQHGDLERLMAVWADDEEIACVHPGGPRLIGPRAIRASFEQLFANGAVPAQPVQVRRLVAGSTAVHSVVERLRVMTEEGPQTAWVQSTNVYLKTGLGWRLVVHHASPGSAAEPSEPAERSAVLH